MDNAPPVRSHLSGQEQANYILRIKLRSSQARPLLHNRIRLPSLGLVSKHTIDVGSTNLCAVKFIYTFYAAASAGTFLCR